MLQLGAFLRRFKHQTDDFGHVYTVFNNVRREWRRLVMRDDIEAFQNCLSIGDFDTLLKKSDNFQNIAYWASSNGLVKIVQHLLTHKECVVDFVILDTAIRKGHHSCAVFLSDKHGHPDIRYAVARAASIYGNHRTLAWAIKYVRPDLLHHKVGFMIEACISQYGQTNSGHFDCFQFLLDNVDTDFIKQSQKEELVSFAIEVRGARWLRVFLKHNFHITLKHMASALTKNDTVCMDLLFDNGIDVGSAFLELGDIIKTDHVFNRLRERGADINRVGNNGTTTPLLSAIRHAAHDHTMRLIDAGANIEAHGFFHITALLQAVKCRNLRVVKRLLQKQANVNHQMSCGRTALHIAVENADLQMIKCLLEAGANINAVKFGDQTPTILSLHPGNPSTSFSDKEKISLLLIQSNGMIASMKDNKGKTALFYAAKFNRNEALKVLIEKEKMPMHMRLKRSLFKIVIERGNARCLDVLLSSENFFCWTDQNELQRVISIAIASGRVDAFKRLLPLVGRYVSRSDPKYHEFIRALKKEINLHARCECLEHLQSFQTFAKDGRSASPLKK